MKAKSKVSVIIVNWNGKHHLEHCLPALRQQSYQANEIIIVDNASTDDSVEFLKSNFPTIKLVSLSENQGFSGGNIKGFEVAIGDYVVLLNNDTKPLTDWLEQLVKCADEHSDVGIVASHMTDWEGKFTDTAGDGCSVTGRGFKLFMNQPTSIPIKSQYVFSACAGAALYKRALLNEIGFLDERFFMNAEDTDLAFRAQLADWKVYLCANAEVRHRISGSQGSYSDKAVYFSSRNHIWLYLKCMPTRLIVKYALSFWIHFFSSLLFFAKRKQAGAYLAGFLAALKSLPDIRQDRKKILGARKVSIQKIEQQLTPLSTLFRKKLAAFRRSS